MLSHIHCRKILFAILNKRYARKKTLDQIILVLLNLTNKFCIYLSAYTLIQNRKKLGNYLCLKADNFCGRLDSHSCASYEDWLRFYIRTSPITNPLFLILVDDPHLYKSTFSFCRISKKNLGVGLIWVIWKDMLLLWTLILISLGLVLK